MAVDSAPQALADGEAEPPIDEGAASLLKLLPKRLRRQLKQHARPAPGAPRLKEVLLHGHRRPALARLSDGATTELRERVPLSEALEALSGARRRCMDGDDDAGQRGGGGAQRDQARPRSAAGGKGGSSGGGVGGGGPLFDSDNRMALPGCLHRISAAAGRDRAVCGLTYRVGRHVPGAAAPLLDILTQIKRAQRGGGGGGGGGGAGGSASLGGGGGGAPSLLLLGRPGAGKTTLLRDVARVCADELGLSVVVVDTSNEIAGDGAEPHPCIGRALRLQVPHNRSQAEVMLEAVQNHGPEVIIVDEIGSKEVRRAGTAGPGAREGGDGCVSS
ncbi:Uncharacterized protein MNEG_11405 [Monoraphidium neglectum]|uniref:ATPase AAA-type core domain-containing protein n=1 Tax=Monoraphidium neglectum TaxID=145388 RepID=A0A0D2MPD5_9CHLO|nr:Uncharacterized protein MNEG_11405 [Monoraphidium neglectum]KIY96555.1 Uncharacterized protein MNEG_11405 [Monoraphidium neglectum]|eukprot:XP_013895575.1 Uncharacterized protein MNEG_11405 [Monoraphidium neglectum]